MWVVKLIKEDWLIVLHKNSVQNNFILLLKSFIRSIEPI